MSIDSDSLKTKRLCRRHNSGFGRVDTQAGRFIRTIQKVDEILANRPAFPVRAYLFSGFDIERWLLKTLLNIYYSRLSVNPQLFTLPSNIPAAFNSPLPSPYGLYVPFVKIEGEIHSFKIEKNAEFNLITEGNTVTGIKATLSGLQLVFILAGTLPYSQEFSTTHTQRPKLIVFFERQESVCITMGWTEGAKMDLWISRGDPKAKIPEGIFSDYD